MSKRYIDTDALIEYANNQKSKQIDANDIARFPIADVWENVNGIWEITGAERGAAGIEYHWKKCSVCGYEYSHPFIYNFCPNCGAKMGGGERND